MTEWVDGCVENPTGVLVAVLRGLRRRADDLRAALDGRSLRVSLTLADTGARRVHRVMFTPAGNVLLAQPENLGPNGFVPHIEVRCEPVDLRRIVLGELTLNEATWRGTVILHSEVGTLDKVLGLVGEELRKVLNVEDA
ncbi:MAG TPA: hypothetical protein VHF47_14225 [Acidimicrobiales bacterium]|nr:hypothetical protein [Acidimicrobiales bacterium]